MKLFIMYCLKLAIVLVIAAVFAALLVWFAVIPRHPVVAILAPDYYSASEICFLAVGRQGYGNSKTRSIALAMEQMAQARPTHFVVLAGDNFYPGGVASVEDSQWLAKFENLYSTPLLSGMPFFAVAGNHDHAGNVEAQLEYARLRRGSARWRMEGLNYARDFGVAGDQVLLRIVFLDTVRFRSHPQRYEEFLKQAFAHAGEPRWRIVVGHYPVKSATENQISRQMVLSDLLPAVRENEVDLYVSANDRFQQLLGQPPAPIHVSTSGGGERLDRDVEPKNSTLEYIQPRHGFARVCVESKTLAVELFDADGGEPVSRILEK